MRRCRLALLSISLGGCFNPDDPGQESAEGTGGSTSTAGDPSTGAPTSMTATAASAVTSGATDPDTGSTASSSTGPGVCEGFVCGEVLGVDCGTCQIGDCIDNLLCCAAPAEAIVIDTPGDARGVYVAEDVMYVADFDEGFREFDISNLASPVETSNITQGSVALDIDATSTRAYVAWGAMGLVVVDISEPGAPVDIASEPVIEASKVDIEDDYAYVASGAAGMLNVVDISVMPMLVGGIAVGGEALGVAVGNDRAFVSSGNATVAVFNISDPADPQPSTNFVPQGDPVDIAIDGDTAYVAERDFGVEILDISDPDDPQAIGAYAIDGDVQGVAVSMDQVVVAHGDGTTFVDVSDQQAPIELGEVAAPGTGDAHAVFIFGDRAFVSAGLAGVQVIEMAECAGGR